MIEWLYQISDIPKNIDWIILDIMIVGVFIWLVSIENRLKK
jgi:hypothetical protein